MGSSGRLEDATKPSHTPSAHPRNQAGLPCIQSWLRSPSPCTDRCVSALLHALPERHPPTASTAPPAA
ncbi:hypothetical protein DPX16_0231 [Anabarilius grahami]|uniref:Uncharacterized protein n=1 Tax=Anabarilius grahami TaxID=495550 RepID=A0A3N0Z4I3_ANAGA|nr:hypothetical protein DPX16_0231 [Anabarilius grahami]